MKLKLIRDLDSGMSTLGRLYCEDEFLCYTLENTWKDNEVRVSCIPKGSYRLSPKSYGKYYNIIEKPIQMLRNVPGRSEILIHWGNYPKDTLGCILLGDSKGIDAVFNSRKTFNKFYSVITNAESIEIL